MAIPDATYFGPENITFGQLRQTTDPLERISFLKKRLDAFFINQIDALDKRSPFPLAIMSCVAIETIGTIFIDKKNDSSQAYQFSKVLSKVDNKLSSKLTSRFLKNFKDNWPEKTKITVTTVSGLIYSYFRNTLIHGYYAQGVYLNDSEGFKWEEGPGYLVLNPNWLWTRVKEVYNLYISEALQKKENKIRITALEYLDDILK